MDITVYNIDGKKYLSHLEYNLFPKGKWVSKHLFLRIKLIVILQSWSWDETVFIGVTIQYWKKEWVEKRGLLILGKPAKLNRPEHDWVGRWPTRKQKVVFTKGIGFLKDIFIRLYRFDTIFLSLLIYSKIMPQQILFFLVIVFN